MCVYYIVRLELNLAPHIVNKDLLSICCWKGIKLYVQKNGKNIHFKSFKFKVNQQAGKMTNAFWGGDWRVIPYTGKRASSTQHSNVQFWREIMQKNQLAQSLQKINRQKEHQKKNNTFCMHKILFVYVPVIWCILSRFFMLIHTGCFNKKWIFMI